MTMPLLQSSCYPVVVGKAPSSARIWGKAGEFSRSSRTCWTYRKGWVCRIRQRYWDLLDQLHRASICEMPG